MSIRLKSYFSSFLLVSLFFSACAGIDSDNDSDDKVVTNVKVTSDYSMISVTWDADENYYGFHDVYISKDDDVNNAKQTISSHFTVDEPGHYYVWVRTGYKGPFSECKEVDVTFINPGSITKVDTSIFGVEIQFQKPNDAGEYVKFAYKKTDETKWNYTPKGILSDTHRINLDNGTYVFKLLVSDKYETYVSSEETEPITYAFNDEKYGKKPECPAYVEKGYFLRTFTSSATEEYYIQCTKGEYVAFDILDYYSFDWNRISGGYSNIGTLSYSDFADLKMEVYISGIDRGNMSVYELEGLVCSKIHSAKIAQFTCPHDGYYVIRLIRSGYGNYYGLTRIE